MRAMYNRWCKRRTCDLSDTSSHSNEHYLSTPEKKARMSKLKQRVCVAEKQVQNLRAKIKELTQQQGDDVDANLNADLLGIMNENCENIEQAYPEGSFARLFLGRATQSSFSERCTADTLAPTDDQMVSELKTDF